MSQNESQLGSLTSYTPYNKVGLINSARYQGIANSGQSEVMRDGIQMQAAIVTTPPNWYRLN